ncbi:phosphonatase-like hydrolase [Rhodococcus rhodnii]|uniref:Haloacid dehalogenase-like hydrolase n=2 Tax=Rhodococcus rhodnii TaxID=38312 RepID=R7WHL8_9NOCA|nr:phosphonatase-like hydrolase [Rhodococcus rhodnii]EOM74562.1 haloacid dehalogenase-like hydrolase [Rhodococcus rhodnii LMG 5362]TXG89713.1 phosphonatase-like hydrolase [Rhodococcus rhodnii]
MSPVTAESPTAAQSSATAQSSTAEPSRISLVVFDMAGTTVEDGGLVRRAFVAADEHAGLAATDAERAEMLDYVDVTMGQSKITVFRHLAHGDEATAQAANAAFEAAYAAMVAGGEVSAMPGALDTFAELRARHVKIALTTGFARDTQNAILDALGWREIADVALCPGDGVRGRPHPDMPLTALLRTETESVSSMIVVGDSASDIVSGVRAGARASVGVLTGAHDRDRFVAAGATHVLGSVAEIPALITALDDEAVR